MGACATLLGSRAGNRYAVLAEAPQPSHSARTQSCLGDALRGVSVHHLNTELLEKVRHADLDIMTSKVYDIELPVIRTAGATVMCPRDGRMGASYVDSIHGLHEAGKATHMLSYTWGYVVKDIADTLAVHCQDIGLDTKRTYFWICCLCINQHRVREAAAKGESVPFAEFRREFGERVTGVGHIVAMMSPWQAPRYIQRVWCNFEMFTALQTAGTEVSIVMTPVEARDLQEKLEADSGDGESLQQVWRTLADISVEKAQASVEEDRTRILELIREGPGYNEFNKVLTKHLQTWMVSSCDRALREKLEAARRKGSVSRTFLKLCDVVGELFMRVGQLDRAIELLSTGHAVCEEQGALASEVGVKLARRLGVAKRERGDLAGALDQLLEAKALHDRFRQSERLDAKSKHTMTTEADLFMSIGLVKYEQGDQEEALKLFSNAKRIRETSETMETVMGALLLRNIGAAHHALGCKDAAQEAYREAWQIHEHTGTLDSPAGAFLLTSIGTVKRECGDIAAALELFRKAQAIRESTCTMETSFGADLLKNIGIAERELGHDARGALAILEQARSIRLKTNTLATPDGASLLLSIGFTLKELHDPLGALAEYEEAEAILRKAGALETPSGALLFQSIAAARFDVSDFDAGDAALVRAHEIHVQGGTLRTPPGAFLLTAMGERRCKRGETQAAMAILEEALQVREETGTLEAPYGAYLLRLLGVVKADLGDLSAAWTHYQQAHGIRQQTGTLETGEGAALLANMGLALLEQGDASATWYLEEAIRIAGDRGLFRSWAASTRVLQALGSAHASTEDWKAALGAYEQCRDMHETRGTLTSTEGRAICVLCEEARSNMEGTPQAQTASSKASAPPLRSPLSEIGFVHLRGSPATSHLIWESGPQPPPTCDIESSIEAGPRYRSTLGSREYSQVF